MNVMDNEMKAKLYDQFLSDHNKKATEVSSLQNKIDLSEGDKKRIKELKSEMAELQRKAMSLGSL